MVSSSAFLHPSARSFIPRGRFASPSQSAPRGRVGIRPRCAADPPKSFRFPNLLTSKSPILPLLTNTARVSYKLFWRTLMSQLAPSDNLGRYVRPKSNLIPQYESGPFGETVSKVSRSLSGFQDELSFVAFTSLNCPWCHRVLLARALLQLGSKIELRSLTPGKEGMWRVTDPSLFDFKPSTIKDVYLHFDRKYSGRFTAPLLINTDMNALVSNESSEILQWFSTHDPVVIDEHSIVCLRPREDQNLDVDIQQLDTLCNMLNDNVNNGVYKCGFATSQLAYDEAQNQLFCALDHVEALLQKTRFLCSSTVITEADIILFPTIFRFDSIYALLFRASRKCIRADYPAISEWLRDMYNLPGVGDTCDLQSTRYSYYQNLFPLNPSYIVTAAPALNLSPIPDRQCLGSK